MEKYCVVTNFEGEQNISVMTIRELANHWQSNDDACIGEEITAFEYVNGQMIEVDVDEIARAYLRDQEEIEQEYRDYCETVNEYGYDYYEDQDQLEMGFNPYMGCYDDDC